MITDTSYITWIGGLPRLKLPYRQSIQNRAFTYNSTVKHTCTIQIAKYNPSIKEIKNAESLYEQSLIKAYILETFYKEKCIELFWQDDWKRKVYDAYLNVAFTNIVFNILKEKIPVN